jgi:hypothetical protein
VPVFGTVFLAGFLLTFWLVEEDDLSLPFSVLWPRLLVLLLMVLWLLFIQRSFWRLKRVDADDTHIYVTNYWTTLRYPWTDVARIEEKKRLNRRVVNFWLRAPGRFGQVISFLPGSFFDEWMAERKRTGEG